MDKMADKDYKEKIKKLLALSESDNENEAKSALLKAKMLMAKHKISEADLKSIEKQGVRQVRTQFTCSKRREPWMVALSIIIGQNFCCQAYREKQYNQQTQTICFIGLEDDIDACTAIFEYAVDCVRAGVKRIQKEYKDDKFHVKRFCDGYGFGFASGVNAAFEKQKESDETGWGLVMVIPAEVTEATKDFNIDNFTEKAQKQMLRAGYYEGHKDGEKFDPSIKLTEEEKDEYEMD